MDEEKEFTRQLFHGNPNAPKTAPKKGLFTVPHFYVENTISKPANSQNLFTYSDLARYFGEIKKNVDHIFSQKILSVRNYQPDPIRYNPKNNKVFMEIVKLKNYFYATKKVEQKNGKIIEVNSVTTKKGLGRIPHPNKAYCWALALTHTLNYFNAPSRIFKYFYMMKSYIKQDGHSFSKHDLRNLKLEKLSAKATFPSFEQVQKHLSDKGPLMTTVYTPGMSSKGTFTGHLTTIIGARNVMMKSATGSLEPKLELILLDNNEYKFVAYQSVAEDYNRYMKFLKMKHYRANVQPLRPNPNHGNYNSLYSLFLEDKKAVSAARGAIDNAGIYYYRGAKKLTDKAGKPIYTPEQLPEPIRKARKNFMNLSRSEHVDDPKLSKQFKKSIFGQLKRALKHTNGLDIDGVSHYVKNACKQVGATQFGQDVVTYLKKSAANAQKLEKDLEMKKRIVAELDQQGDAATKAMDQRMKSHLAPHPRQQAFNAVNEVFNEYNNRSAENYYNGGYQEPELMATAGQELVKVEEKNTQYKEKALDYNKKAAADQATAEVKRINTALERSNSDLRFSVIKIEQETTFSLENKAVVKKSNRVHIPAGPKPNSKFMRNIESSASNKAAQDHRLYCNEIMKDIKTSSQNAGLKKFSKLKAVMRKADSGLSVFSMVIFIVATVEGVSRCVSGDVETGASILMEQGGKVVTLVLVGAGLTGVKYSKNFMMKGAKRVLKNLTNKGLEKSMRYAVYKYGMEGVKFAGKAGMRGLSGLGLIFIAEDIHEVKKIANRIHLSIEDGNEAALFREKLQNIIESRNQLDTLYAQIRRGRQNGEDVRFLSERIPAYKRAIVRAQKMFAQSIVHRELQLIQRGLSSYRQVYQGFDQLHKRLRQVIREKNAIKKAIKELEKIRVVTPDPEGLFLQTSPGKNLVVECKLSDLAIGQSIKEDLEILYKLKNETDIQYEYYRDCVNRTKNLNALYKKNLRLASRLKNEELEALYLNKHEPFRKVDPTID